MWREFITEILPDLFNILWEEAFGLMLSLIWFVCAIALISLVLAFPTMLLWNWLMFHIFALPKIGFLQAMGLLALCRLLFFDGRKPFNQ